ncbi:hypothetical protein M9H77_08420 [Catharanthus roseus]|uniref:Uncharacterized protein n=1 Tax=Catharanthus roseus TaxID=4058 RepID=A0ACC0BXT1_CATRO|nr:hypothetical protein M9H77_08420 [Catharanthus roseus]
MADVDQPLVSPVATDEVAVNTLAAQTLMNQATIASFSLLNSGASTVVGPNSQHSNNSGISMPAVDKAISSPPLLSSYLNAGNDDSDLRGDNNRRSNHGRDGRRDGKNFDQRTQTPLLRTSP